MAPKSPPKQTSQGHKHATSALEIDKGAKKKRTEEEEGAENDPKKGKQGTRYAVRHITS